VEAWANKQLAFAEKNNIKISCSIKPVEGKSITKFGA